MHFKRKDSSAHYPYNGPLRTFVALLGAGLGQFPCRVFFGGFWALTNTWALMNKRNKRINPQKIPPAQYLSLHSAQKGFKGSQHAIVKTMGTAIFSNKMHFLVNCHVEALEAAEVNILVL